MYRGWRAAKKFLIMAGAPSVGRWRLLALSLPLALWLASLANSQWGWASSLPVFPFLVLYCGSTAALWIYGVETNLVAMSLGFAVTCFYFSPAPYEYLSGKDWLRVMLMLAILFAPIRLAWRLEPKKPGSKAAYLPTLDGWRAVAILLVMLDHLLRGVATDHHSEPPSGYLLGQHGVNIFFALSGFLITWKLLEEKRETGRISLTQFYRRRIYRIFPAAFLFLTAMGVLSACGLLPVTRLDFASAILYFRNFVPVFWPSLSNAHFWSLSLEEQFYLFLPSALVLVGLRRFAMGAALLAIGCAAWRWYFFHAIATADPPLSIRFRTDLRLDGLLCGCLVAVALGNQATRRYWTKLSTPPVVCALLLLTAGVVYRAGERTLFAESLLLPLVLVGTMVSAERFPARILEWKPLRWVGRISYSLYLWQQFFLLCPVNHWLLRPLHRFPFNVLATFGCAIISYYFVERPLLRHAHDPHSRPFLLAFRCRQADPLAPSRLSLPGARSLST